MRKLLNTLFVINEDAYLTLDGENLVVTRNKQETHRYALHTLEGIVCFTYAGASPALMGACARRGIDLCFFDPYGRFQARTVGEERGNVLLRQTQYRVSDDPAQSCRYARSFILGKVYNARWVLERATRDHPQRVPVEKLKRTSTQLAAALDQIGARGFNMECIKSRPLPHVPFEYYFYVQLVCPAGSTGAECQALLDTLTPVCSTLRLLGAFTLDGTEK